MVFSILFLFIFVFYSLMYNIIVFIFCSYMMDIFLTLYYNLEDLQYLTNWMLSIIFLIFAILLICWIFWLIKRIKKDKSLSISQHIKKFIKDYRYLLIWFLLFLTNFMQVSILYEIIDKFYYNFVEVIQSKSDILPDWYFWLYSMNSLYVLIIITLAILLIWISFWSKKILIPWIVIYILWIIVAFAVPYLAYIF